MTREELLQLKLIEECAEVQHRMSKLMQYGAEESQSTAPRNLGAAQSAPPGTNWERLQAEYKDLCAVGVLLGLHYPSETEIQAKLEKIAKYQRYSEELGRVTP